MMWGYSWGVGWGWMVLGSLMMVAFWGAIIWLLYLLIRGASRDDHRSEDARSIAARRLARGEITPDEYDRIVAKLRS